MTRVFRLVHKSLRHVLRDFLRSYLSAKLWGGIGALIVHICAVVQKFACSLVFEFLSEKPFLKKENCKINFIITNENVTL